MGFKVKDKIYGGVFLSRESALIGKVFGCPPTEIIIPYFKGEKMSYISGIEMESIREKIEAHLQKCKSCRTFLISLAKDTSFNKHPV